MSNTMERVRQTILSPLRRMQAANEARTRQNQAKAEAENRLETLKAKGFTYSKNYRDKPEQNVLRGKIEQSVLSVNRNVFDAFAEHHDFFLTGAIGHVLFNQESLEKFSNALQATTKVIRNAQQGNYDPNALLQEATRHAASRYDGVEERSDLAKALHAVFSRGTRKGDLQERLEFLNQPQDIQRKLGSKSPVLASLTPAARINLVHQLFENPLRKPVETEKYVYKPLQVSDLVGVHLTNYLPREGIIYPLSKYTGYPRDTIHFTLNGTVSSHEWGSWEDKKIAVITPIEKITHWLANAIPSDSFGRGPLRLPFGSVVVVEKSVAEKEGLREGQNLGRAVVKVIDENNYPGRKYLPPFHAAVHAQLREMGFTPRFVGKEDWADVPQGQGIAQVKRALETRPSGEISEIPGMTYALHIYDSKYSRNTSPNALRSALEELKTKGTINGKTLTPDDLKLKDTNNNYKLRLAEEFASDETAQEIRNNETHLQQMLNVGVKTENFREIKKTREELKILRAYHEVSKEIEQERLKRLAQMKE